VVGAESGLYINLKSFFKTIDRTFACGEAAV
jgi:hypothetical protein